MGRNREHDEFESKCLEELRPFLERKKSEATRRKYAEDMLTFCRYLNKTPNKIRDMRYSDEKLPKHKKERYRFEDLVKDFYHYLQTEFKSRYKEGKVSQSSASSRTIGIRAWFRHIHSPLELESGDTGELEYSIGEVPLTHHQLQLMFKSATPRGRAILSLGMCMPLGSSQFVRLKRSLLKTQIAMVEQGQLKVPFEIEIKRGKTGKVLRNFVTGECLDSLRDYWRSLGNGETEYVFEEKGKHISEDCLNDELQRMWDTVNPNIPRRLHWHLIRKYVYSTALNKGCGDVAKIFIGKGVSKDLLTYMTGVNLKQEWDKIKEEVCLTGMTNERYEIVKSMEKELKEQRQALSIIAKYVAQELENRKLTLRKEGIEGQQQFISGREEVEMSEDIKALDKFVRGEPIGDEKES